MMIMRNAIWNDFDNETEWSNDLQESVERGGSSSPRLDSAFVRGGGAASVIIITDHDHHHDHGQNHHHHQFKTSLCDYQNCSHYHSQSFTSYSLSEEEGRPPSLSSPITMIIMIVLIIIIRAASVIVITDIIMINNSWSYSSNSHFHHHPCSHSHHCHHLSRSYPSLLPLSSTTLSSNHNTYLCDCFPNQSKNRLVTKQEPLPEVLWAQSFLPKVIWIDYQHHSKGNSCNIPLQ